MIAMLRNIVLFLLIFSFSSYLFARPGEPDSLQYVRLYKLAKEASRSNLKEAYLYLHEAKLLAQKNKSNKFYAKTLYEESQYLFQDGRYGEMVDSCLLAIALLKKENLISEEAKCYSKIGVGYANMNKYKDALEAFFVSHALSESISDNKAAAAVIQNIGIMYTNLKDWDNALKYSMKSLNYKKSVSDSAGMASSYSNIGNIYYGKKEYAESVRYFHLAMEVDNNSGANKNTVIPIRYSNMANAFMEMGKYDSAVFYNEAALKFLGDRKETWQRLWCQVLTNLADSWFRKGNLQKASYYLNECESCENDVTDITYLTNLYPLKANYYKETGNYREAVKYRELASDVKDSILANTQNLEYQKMAIQYEFDKKAHEDSLRYQLNLSEQRSATATYKSRMYLILSVAMLVSFSAVIVISWLKVSQRVKRRKELERVRLGIAGDLHDDIGSTISSIQIISSMMGMQNESNPKIKEAAENINALSNKVAGGIREVVWSLNPENDSMEAIVSHMHKIASDILSTAEIPFAFAKNLADPKKKLSPQLRKDFMMVFKEAINNARKYSKANQVDIHIDQHDNKLELRIKDYGCGFDPDTVEMGNGLHNMKRRAKNMNGILNIESGAGSGTVIHLEIPTA